MADLIDRIPPQSLDAEMAVLGSMLIEKEAIIKAVDIVSDEDFYKESHRQIFIVMRDLYLENQAVDAITVTDALKKNKLFADLGGGSYITSLINSVSTAANIEYYAAIVRDKSILRQMINTGTQIVASSFNEKMPANEILDKAGEALFDITQKGAKRGFVDVSKLVHPTLDYLEKLNRDKKDVPGLRTGFTMLDSMTAGLQPAELIIIAARPSMGKTAFALNIAENVALREKKAVAMFSLEMSKEALMLRLLCSAAQVNSHEVRKGIIATKDWSKLTTVAQKFSEAQIFIDDSPGISVLELRARARRLANELKIQGKELAMILIDYIQMMRGSAGRPESRQQEMADISRSLKGLARDLNCPVVALSQLSRKPEEKGREGKPQLSDLRESGAIEQDADVVGFIYREGYYKRDDPDLERKATLILAKQRNGPTGEINLTFRRECTRFENATAMEATPVHQ
ncbi:MAG TPA: replicative DNA helicase [Elusimicrobia bacterium]|nr:MAG: replicative DNA helicase [Elusimicrobia bacterium RIFOXYA12_FULL_49_49]OGS16607.1 MAG: replicative DNA helicase [Elusimicrobia bacterium RIFOXYA2_FULL_47_53]OGS25820.1 MAG: replicative DNA helicase [Elusimicrobia bacterium RIFOXYB12_FULL_50_12]OGS31585.1 MAG: replicative DNA helicase [Elusimicrobia bacterium RIFOXYB2_FULL_46_23]HBU69031.1 replicative DNA helicase [Elusimicrobiota bacterium]